MSPPRRRRPNGVPAAPPARHDTIVVLYCGPREVASWPLEAAGQPPGLGAVDDLARLQLAARRLGCSIRLRHADPELRALLHLCGLAGVISGVADDGASVVEVLRQAEQSEDVGSEEHGDLGDPLA